MRWRRSVNRVRAARIDELRYMERHEPTYARLLAVELLNGANDTIEDGHTDEAVKLLEELVAVLRRDPASPNRHPDNLLITALGLLGHLYLERSRTHDAEDLLEEAVHLQDSGPGGDIAGHHTKFRASNLINLARCRELAGAFDEALDLLQRTSKLIGMQPEPDDSLAGLARRAQTMRHRMLRETGD